MLAPKILHHVAGEVGRADRRETEGAFKLPRQREIS